ncbi:hypothetical protein Z517_10423 [Fonsecaea pedrosoi CBS 271.37]|uniref:MYND-type domain-containing protein n=1 Tax=Fonsecaea pedrosoi CBS 271.37 TaxID=1442368 RepID=A0A0D2DDD3_9EURO|nr:uncharacterized protein Z517_10423 [Fonsecaea pedrosoi CBS 271.37]KIW75681.1 hypothetical protein Z517_10423 [Fonsecaea pedrosoi CBS 271.37]
MELRPLPLEATCIMCPRRGTKVCSSCKDARYCSKNCQKLDWKNHKIICPSFQEPKPQVTEANGRIDGIFYDFLPEVGLVDFRRALVFPGDKQPPKFVWVKTWIVHGGSETFDSKPFFDHAGETDCIYLAHNSIQARDACRDEKDLLRFFFKDDTSKEPPNLAVQAFTRSGACSKYLKGPIILMCGTVGARGHDHFRDVDMRDSRSAADFFSSAYRSGYGDSCLLEKRFVTTAIACPEDITSYQLEGKYHQQVFDGCDSVFQAEGSGIANLLGIPILIRSHIPPKPKRNQYGAWIPQDEENEPTDVGPDSVDALFLLRDITSTTTGRQETTASMHRFRTNDRDYAGTNGFGSSPKASRRSGSFSLVRADGLPLLSLHVEALVGYIRDEVEPRLSHALAGTASGGVVASREAVLNSITQADFSRYFDAFKAAKTLHDHIVAFIPSPYAMSKEFLADMERQADIIWEDQKAAGFKQESEHEPVQQPGVIYL